MALQHVRSEEALLVLQGLSDMVLVFQADGELLDADVRHKKLAKIKHARQLLEAVPRLHHFGMLRAFRRAVTGKKARTLILQVEAKGGDDYVWLEGSAVPLIGDNGAVERVIVVLRDVTERKLVEETLRSLAFHDSLTGLANRRLLMEHMKLSVSQAKRHHGTLALLHMDIDDFKRVNDTYGHDAGDELLQLFAQRLMHCIREVDLFARIGGDEFTILLPTVDSADSIIVVAERIYRALRQPMETAFGPLPVEVSMGIAIFPAHGDDSFTLLRHADVALYEVKGESKNGYRFFQPDMNALHTKEG